MKNETWIVAAKRTPIGSFQGALASLLTRVASKRRRLHKNKEDNPKTKAFDRSHTDRLVKQEKREAFVAIDPAMSLSPSSSTTSSQDDNT